MIGYTYNPVEKTVRYKDQIIQFYCGPELNDLAIILLDFYFQRDNLQETFIHLFTVLQQAKPVEPHLNINNMPPGEKSELDKEIEKQISHIRNGGHCGKVTIQDATRLADLMGNDILFETNHSEMIHYHIMLLLIKKVML